MRTTILLLAMATLAVTTPACGQGPVITHSVINCAGEGQADIAALVDEFRPVLTAGKVDWSAVYQRAKRAGTRIGGCFIAELVNVYLGNRAAPPTLEAGWSAHDALEKFRVQEAGGATFLMADGRKL